jgi:hypothetical protein
VTAESLATRHRNAELTAQYGGKAIEMLRQIRRLVALQALALTAFLCPSPARGEPPVFWYSSFAVYTKDGMLKEVSLPARRQLGSGPLPVGGVPILVPDEGVTFGPKVKSSHGIRVEAGDTVLTCGQVSQDVAYVVDGAGKRSSQLPLLGFESCPLVVDKDLEPIADMEARERTEVVIEAANGSVLQVVGSRFFATDGQRLLDGCEMLPGTVWVFRTKGLTFETRSQRYSVQRDGATIAFTRGGVALTGVLRSRR